MADNLFRMQAVSPELASLMRRLKTIYAITGGEVPKAGGKKDSFNEKKSILIASIAQFGQLVDSRDHSGLSPDSRDYIRLKVTINSELQKLEHMVLDLAETHKKEVEKKSAKLTGDDISARKEVMTSLITDFHAAYKAATGSSHAGAEENVAAGAGVHTMTVDSLMKGNYAGAGIKTRKEEMTGEQMQALAEINEVVQQQDLALDEISKGMDELKEIAEKMHDEFERQEKTLTDLESKTDKTQGVLDKVNDRCGSPASAP